ncbi:MAG: alginate O-acetyltransferase AlgX-related protein [Planctomycetota bacterium]|jgi:hypothetical protein
MSLPAARIRTAADVAVTGAFVLVIMLPTADWILGLDGAPTPVEKRKLAEMPEVECTPRSLCRFPSAFEAYFSDHFGYRKRLIRWHGKVATKWLGVAPSPKVVRGRDGWLFYAGEGVIDYHRARYPFSREELVEWQRVLEARREWLAARDIRYLVVVAPNKHSIYPEYLPAWVNRVGDATRLDQLLEHMNAQSDVAILDLRAPVLAAKGERFLYHRTGTHWNDRGAFVAYRAIMERLSGWFPRARPLSRTDFECRVVESDGRDLAVILGQQDSMREKKPVFVPSTPRRARKADPGEPATVGPRGKSTGTLVMESEDGQIPRAVMFRDSFSIALVPFLSEHFGRIVYVWDYGFAPEALERERPDVVIQELVERALTNVRPTGPQAERPQGPPRR